MKNHFIYKREVEVPPVQEDTEKGITGTDGYTKIVYDSFDINRVIRTITMDDDTTLVLLDDMHERYEERPMFHRTSGQPKKDKKGNVMFERIKDTFQSEIRLTAEEGEELLKLIGINK